MTNLKDKLTESRKRIPNISPQYENLGRIPPQVVHIEQAVIGAALLERGAYERASRIIKADCFYKEEHKEIWDAIRSLREEDKPVDILTITARLRKDERLEYVGGAFYISELTNSVANSENIEEHSVHILDAYMKREMIRICNDAVNEGFDDACDIFDSLSNLSKSLDDLSNEANIMPKGDMKSIAVKVLEVIDRAKTTGVFGVSTGYSALDGFTGGFERNGFNVIAGRPGMGKSALEINCAKNMAKQGMPVAVYIYESTDVNLFMRALSAESMVKLEDMRRGRITDIELSAINNAITKMLNIPLYIKSANGMNINQLCQDIASTKAKYGIEAFFVDYIQLIPCDIDTKGNENTALERICNKLVSTIKRTETTGIILSQLSRDVERRGTSKIPMLSDLRGSGGIEQVADQVYFCYRPEYYGITEIDATPVYEGQLRVICAKNREGRTGHRDMKFVGSVQKVEEYVSLSDYKPSFTNTNIDF